MEGTFRMLKGVREYLTPVLTESAFLERGLLTPDEFVRAGDQLVRTCPSWSWESGDPSKAKAYLPPNKQFLSTQGVPSYQRVSALGNTELVEDMENVEESSQEPDPEGKSEFFEVNAKVAISDEWAGVEDTGKPASSATNTYLEMEEDDLALDEAAANPANGGATVHKARRYDISITYDNYYRTPRVWMSGSDENGSILTPEAIFDDVIQDYANRTVTIDPHPHLSIPHASIHPCQHGPAMLTIIRALQEAGNTPSVDQYFFIFLKFIQSVVPTIEYDYTSDVQAGAAQS